MVFFFLDIYFVRIVEAFTSKVFVNMFVERVLYHITSIICFLSYFLLVDVTDSIC